jgi:hypothetical protein
MRSIVVRRGKVAGLGDATKFETSDPDLRFSFRFDVLERGTTRRCAFEQAHDIAVNAGDMEAASQILAEATTRWGSAIAFQSSRLAKSHSEEREGAAA